MNVREVMTTELVTVQPQTSISEAARLMREADIGDVLIAQDGQPLGILTDRDIAVRVVSEGIDTRQARVGDFMTGSLFTAGPDASVESAADLMGQEQIRRLPIVENGKLVGIVSLGDLAVEAAQEPAAMPEDTVAEALEEISQPSVPRLPIR